MLVLCFALYSCKKEGTGGKSTITGLVYKTLVDHNGNTVETTFAHDEDVYIAYGNSNSFNDDTKTNGEGLYQFEFLTKGDYYVSVYSDCDTCATKEILLTQKVSVTERKEQVEQNITIIKTVEPDDGTASISGTVMVQKYLGTTPYGDPYVAQNRDVFIQYDQDEVYFDRTKTGSDGKFIFRNLIIGNYTVYAYSTCDTCINVKEIKSVAVGIDSNGEKADVGEIIVETP